MPLIPVITGPDEQLVLIGPPLSDEKGERFLKKKLKRTDLGPNF